MSVTAFDRERLFGVEIEFSNLSERDIMMLARKLTDAGLVTAYEGYNHQRRSTWKIVYDASVRNTKHRCGWELVSPPLKGIQGLELIEKAVKILKENGATVDETCGLHVHHDARRWTVNEWKNAYRLYARMELTIDEAMPNSRRGSSNYYCQSNRKVLARRLEQFEAVTTIEGLMNFWNSRYFKVNIMSWQRHGTIEFRQHSGTLNAKKIVNWIVFTQMIVNRAESPRKLKVTFDDQRYKRTNPWRLVAVEFALHNKGDEMDSLVKGAIEFIAGRITHFRERESRREAA